jgi:hypothetical protein
MPRNNETRIADQRKLHAPQGAKTTELGRRDRLSVMAYSPEHDRGGQWADDRAGRYELAEERR